MDPSTHKSLGPDTYLAYTEHDLERAREDWSKTTSYDGSDWSLMNPYYAQHYPVIVTFEAVNGYVNAKYLSVPNGLSAPPDPEIFGFELALSMLKNGGMLTRAGWNGKNQYVFFAEGSQIEAHHSVGNFKRFLNPHFVICTPDGSLSTWVPSINDCLAEDWQQFSGPTI